VCLQVDPEVLLSWQPLLDAAAARPPAAIGDVTLRRERAAAFFAGAAKTMPSVKGVDVARHSLTTFDGAQLALSWYTPTETEPTGSAALYLHGGGMIYSLTETGVFYDWVARYYVAGTGVAILTVDYRVAPEHPHPTPVEDCYAALTWLHDQADTLGVDRSRVAVIGDSAGGGLAAGVSLMARDRGGPDLALQLLIYPMLDDRTRTPATELNPNYLGWSYEDNATGWRALLDDQTTQISPYAAPARATDLSGLPPTYVDTGDLDIFRAEDVDYASRLTAAGVPTELHVYPGCPHGFETIAPDAEVSQRATANRMRRLRAL
jgi:acetyl esterase/lipase